MSASIKQSCPVMTRRKVLTLSAALPLLPLTTVCAQTNPITKVLRLGLTNNMNAQTEQMARAFAGDVYKRSGGRIRIDVYFGAALGAEKEISEDLSAGVLDLAIVSSAGYASKAMMPSLGIFDVPFLFRDLKHARAVLDGAIGKQALKDLDPCGVVGLAWGENGVRQITTRDKAVRAPADLVGIKIRVPQSTVMVEAFKAFGADAQPLPIVDLYSALANGSFDAQENPVGNIKTYDFDKVQKVLSLTNHVYSPAVMMMSKRSFAQLSEDEQMMVRASAKVAAPVSREVNDRDQSKDVEELQRRGMTVVSDIDRAAFVRVIETNHNVFESLFGKKNLEAIQQFAS